VGLLKIKSMADFGFLLPPPPLLHSGLFFLKVRHFLIMTKHLDQAGRKKLKGLDVYRFTI